jgi:hypothetical protein
MSRESRAATYEPFCAIDGSFHGSSETTTKIEPR